MDLSPIGRIQKLYGKNGELAVQLYANAPESFDFFYIPIDGVNIPFYFSCVTQKGSNKMIIRLDDFDKNEWVEEFVGKDFFVSSSACRQEEDEEGFEVLVGFDVMDRRLGALGKIAEFLDYPNNPIYRIDFNGKDILIPIHPDFIVKVDDRKKSIHTELPEGLVETYL